MLSLTVSFSRRDSLRIGVLAGLVPDVSGSHRRSRGWDLCAGNRDESPLPLAADVPASHETAPGAPRQAAVTRFTSVRAMTGFSGADTPVTRWSRIDRLGA